MIVTVEGKAASARPKAATTKSSLPIIYPNREALSSPGLATTAVALGSLLLYLLNRQLPDPERSFAWSLVETWLSELVGAVHHAGVV